MCQFHYLKVRNQDEKHHILFGCQFHDDLMTRFKWKMLNQQEELKWIEENVLKRPVVDHVLTNGC